MKKLVYKSTLILNLCLLTLGLVSCKEEELLPDADRIFRPVEVAATLTPGTKNSIDFSWVNVGNDAVGYTIELSTDGFVTTPVSYTFSAEDFESSVCKVSIPDLQYDSEYSARIIACAVDPSKNSRSVDFPAVTTDALNAVLKSVSDNNVFETSANLYWIEDELYPVSSIVITAVESGEILVFDVSANTDYKLVATGLTPSTAYVAAIYYGDVRYNSRKFTTKAFPTVPEGAILLDETRTDLVAELDALTEGGQYTFVLKAGVTYFIKTIGYVLPNVSVEFMGQSAYDKPHIALKNGSATTGSAMLKLPATSANVSFKNIIIEGYLYDTDENLTTTRIAYIVNQDVACSVTNLYFDNCNLQHFGRTTFRLQNAAALVDNVTVNNCIVSDLGQESQYSFMQTSNGALFKNITIKNSTFYDLYKGFLESYPSVPSSVVVENNTFYNILNSTRYLLHFNNLDISGTISFKANLFGKTISADGTGRGPYYGTAATEIYQDNVAASDFVFVSGTELSPDAYAFPNLIRSTLSSDEIFSNPASADFKLKSSFTSKIGDPRWY